MELFGPDFAGDDTAHAALDALLGVLQTRHSGSVEAVLFYGSCLRSGDLFEGLVDLYVIVGSYRAAHRSLLGAAANRVLAPNVYYLQVEAEGRSVRCKYAVLSLDALERAVSRHSFESYFWGRFSQPVALAYSAGDAITQRVRECLRSAVVTMLDRALPCAPERGEIRALWECALSLSYATELRAEGGNRPGVLVGNSPQFYLGATQALCARISGSFECSADSYSASVSPATRRRARCAWAMRRMLGKSLSVLRLLKALFTFEGGFDYIAWKLERHSGRPIVIPPRVRRYPLIFVWGLMWKLYREGVFR